MLFDDSICHHEFILGENHDDILQQVLLLRLDEEDDKFALTSMEIFEPTHEDTGIDEKEVILCLKKAQKWAAFSNPGLYSKIQENKMIINAQHATRFVQQTGIKEYFLVR